MTDIMKLADDYAAKNRAAANAHEYGTSVDVIEAQDDMKLARAALQSAIEALQGENERLKDLEITWRICHERSSDAARDLANERDAYQQAADKMAAEHKAERDALAAKLDELQRQEPIGCGYVVKWERGTTPSTYETGHAQVLGVPVYAAPKALEPLTDDAIWKNDALMSANSGYGATFETLREIIRAVEAAHGITKGTP